MTDSRTSNARVWRFDRYVNGRLRAEGIRITKADTAEQAFAKATQMAYSGDVLVLVEGPAPEPRAGQQPMTLHREITDFADRLATDRKYDGDIVEDLRAILDAYPAPPPVPDYAHLANEWADMATNGIQWLRNIRDGISTPAEALDEMESNHTRIQALRAGPTKCEGQS